MKKGNLIVKLVSVAVIAACLIYYQNIAIPRAAAAQANEEAVSEVNAYNKEIQRRIEEAQRKADADAAAIEAAKASGPYENGTFQGSGLGYGGMIYVSVTTEGGYISAIEVTDHSTEDPAYYMLAESVIPKMVDEQSAEVDTVSGATLSSTGIIQAVADALSKAAK